jgi:hypothetical protein
MLLNFIQVDGSDTIVVLTMSSAAIIKNAAMEFMDYH